MLRTSTDPNRRVNRLSFVSVLLVVVLLVGTGIGTVAADAPGCSTVTYSGDGTEANPYEVSNVDQLQCIEQQGLDANYVQVSDIDASGTSAWNGGSGFEPIGDLNVNRDTEFNGTFDGADYTISGLYIDRGSTDDVGLFGFVGSAGRFENVGVEAADVTGAGRVGGLVGRNDGTITESYATGNVSSESDSGAAGGLVGGNTGGNVTESYATGSVSGNRAGGLVGSNDGGNVTESYATGSVSGDLRVGGLVGSNNNGGTVERSYANGSVNGAGSVGGLVGQNTNRDTVTDSYATGDVSGAERVGGLVGNNAGNVTESHATGSVSGDGTVGGLVGFDVGGNVTESYATGDVSGNDDVGGLVGGNGGTVRDSYATGSVSGNFDVGGLVGGNNNGGTVRDSYATGDISDVNERVGGLVGSNDGTVTESYATGSVSDTGQFVGGLVGVNEDESTVGESYATGDVSGDRRVGGLVGQNDGGLAGVSDGNVTESYATGDVSGNNNVGGLVGENFGNVTESYATGSVSGNSFGGGLVGSNSLGNVTESYWDTETTGQSTSAGNGTGLNTSEMTGTAAVSNMTGFDFTNTWDTVTNPDDYPILAWQNQTGGNPAPVCSNVNYNGAGTSSNPYEVSNVDQLQCINSQGLDANYVQVSDIDASGTSSWNTGKGFDPIGNSTDLFTGTFDGADHTVSGLYIDRGSTSEVGLFGSVDSPARLENVGLENIDITGNEFVGGLVGKNEGTVERSYATGNVSGTDDVGGLIGLNGGNVTESYATGDVSGNDDVGGLVGFNDGTVGESYATGSGSVSGTDDVGGLVGFNDSGTVTDSYWDTVTTGQSTSAGNGTGLNTSEMTGTAAVSNMTGFDFTNTWDTVTNPDDYPILAWQNQTGGNPAPVCSNVNYNGAGTSSNPYEVSNVDQLQCINSQGLDANYVQVSDIDASGTSSWNNGKGFSPIANDTNSRTRFTGTFDGAGHDISDLHIDRGSTDNVGLFGFMDFGGRLENIRLNNVDINGSRNVGGLVGRNSQSTITNSYATGSVSAAGSNVGGLTGQNAFRGTVRDSYATGDVSGNDDVGGLVGLNDGTVTESYATGDVFGTSRLGGIVGGLVGKNDGNVTESYATGNVSGESDSGAVGGLVGDNQGNVTESYATGTVSSESSAGGLVGLNGAGTVRDSYATGDVSGNRAGGLVGGSATGNVTESYATGNVSGTERVGGLVGLNVAGTVRDSYATGDISGNFDVGGLVGLNSGNVTNSYATGDVSGDRRVGGLVGLNSGTVTESYANGSVSGTYRVGGLVGFNDGTVTESYATGSGSVSGTDDVGGLVGFNDSGTVTDSYWDTETTGQSTSAGNGTGLNTSEMTGSSATNNMLGFDFQNTWKTVTNPDDYPVLIQGNSDYQLSNLDPAEANVTEGDDPINVSVDVENVGDIQGDQDIELTVENSSGVQFSDTISGVQLGVGAKTTVEFTDVPAGTLSPGEYDHIVSTDDDTIEGNLTVGVFTKPLTSRFENPPKNTGEFDPILYEDLDGDGSGTDVDQTVAVFGELIRGRDLGITDKQARKLNWNQGSPETEVTPSDMVSLFGKQIRAD